MGGASMTSLACSPLTSLISLAQEFFYVMNELAGRSTVAMFRNR